MASSSKLAGSDIPGGDDLPLPLDALYEILLRLPAKELCRLRAVCRPWSALLSDPRFIAAHAARHPGPLIIAEYHPLHHSNFLFDILDLSGRVIKRFRKLGGWGSNEWVTCGGLDVVCIKKGIRRNCVLLNPATGSLFALPEGYVEEHAVQAQNSRNFMHLVCFGQVASTGQYKVLRLIDGYSYEGHLCEVFTFDTSSRDERWRGKRPSPGRVNMRNWCSVVIKGIAYFLLCEFSIGPGPICVASFDLGTEDWRTTLRGPTIHGYISHDDLSLTSLNDCLVVIHSIQFHGSTMDLWFLMDFEEGLWVKHYSIQHKLSFALEEYRAHPLLILNDGRILTYIGTRGLLRIYDPRTSTSTDVADIGLRGEVSLYTGNLLSLATDAG